MASPAERPFFVLDREAVNATRTSFLRLWWPASAKRSLRVGLAFFFIVQFHLTFKASRPTHTRESSMTLNVLTDDLVPYISNHILEYVQTRRWDPSSYGNLLYLNLDALNQYMCVPGYTD